MPSYPSTLTEEVPWLPAPPQLRVSKALTGRTSNAAEHQEAGRAFHPPQGCRGTVPPPCLPRSMGARSSPAPPAIPWSPAGQLQARQRVRKTTDTGNAGKNKNAGKTHRVHALGSSVPCCARSPAAMASPCEHGAVTAHPEQPRRCLINALRTVQHQGHTDSTVPSPQTALPLCHYQRQHCHCTMPTACGCWTRKAPAAALKEGFPWQITPFSHKTANSAFDRKSYLPQFTASRSFHSQQTATAPERQVEPRAQTPGTRGAAARPRRAHP